MTKIQINDKHSQKWETSIKSWEYISGWLTFSTCLLFMIIFHFILGAQHFISWIWQKFKKLTNLKNWQTLNKMNLRKVIEIQKSDKCSNKNGTLVKTLE